MSAYESWSPAPPGTEGPHRFDPAVSGRCQSGSCACGEWEDRGDTLMGDLIAGYVAHVNEAMGEASPYRAS